MNANTKIKLTEDDLALDPRADLAELDRDGFCAACHVASRHASALRRLIAAEDELARLREEVAELRRVRTVIYAQGIEKTDEWQ